MKDQVWNQGGQRWGGKEERFILRGALVSVVFGSTFPKGFEYFYKSREEAVKWEKLKDQMRGKLNRGKSRWEQDVQEEEHVFLGKGRKRMI